MNMTSQDKISTILGELKDKSDISPNPKIIDFSFNFNFVASGVLMSEDEINILLKLEKEGIIKFHFPKIDTGKRVSIPNGDITKKDLMYQLGKITIELLSGFNKYYNKHCKKRLSFGLLESSSWSVPNPIYLMLRFFMWIKSRGKGTLFAIIGSTLIYNYSQAFKNIKIAGNYITSFFIK